MTLRTGRLPRAVLVASTLFVAPAAGQQWSIEAHGGRIRSALDPAAARSETFMVGLRYDDAHTAFRISGGIPTMSSQPLWGAINAGKRLTLRRGNLVAGMDLAAHGFLLHDRVDRTRQVPGLLGSTLESAPSLSGHALAGHAMPLVGFESGRFQAHARAGISHYFSDLGDRRERTVRLADAQITFAPTSSIAFTPTLRHFAADEAAYTYAGLSAVAARGPASLWGTIGHWLATEQPATPWAAGASLRVFERATLHASARRDAFDPLYLNPPQTAWSLGLSVLLGRPTAPSAPVPAAYSNGLATIRLPLSQSPAATSIAGDFNGWKPQPMQRTREHWTYSVRVAPGVYNYAFVDARGDWFVPEKHPGRKDDGMGGHVAVLVVQQ